MRPRRLYRLQRGFSIPAAIFVLVVVAMLGAAMVNILNEGQEATAREVISIRALMAAESGAERGLNLVLEGGTACTGTLAAPAALTTLNFASTGMTGCTATVNCALSQVDADNDGNTENYFTLQSTGQCGPPGNRSVRIVQVQARE